MANSHYKSSLEKWDSISLNLISFSFKPDFWLLYLNRAYESFCLIFKYTQGLRVTINLHWGLEFRPSLR